jgi:hypothetical protein
LEALSMMLVIFGPLATCRLANNGAAALSFPAAD